MLRGLSPQGFHLSWQAINFRQFCFLCIIAHDIHTSIIYLLKRFVGSEIFSKFVQFVTDWMRCFYQISKKVDMGVTDY